MLKLLESLVATHIILYVMHLMFLKYICSVLQIWKIVCFSFWKLWTLHLCNVYILILYSSSHASVTDNLLDFCTTNVVLFSTTPTKTRQHPSSCPWPVPLCCANCRIVGESRAWTCDATQRYQSPPKARHELPTHGVVHYRVEDLFFHSIASCIHIVLSRVHENWSLNLVPSQCDGVVQ